jgi:hypothetical protein
MTNYILFEDIENESKKIIKRIVDGFLADKTFNIRDADFLIKHLNDKIMAKLTELSENFKYILSVTLLGNDNSAHIEDMALYVDTRTDGIISEKFVFKNITCIVNLICFAL